jgi:hypothetical protein
MSPLSPRWLFACLLPLAAAAPADAADGAALRWKFQKGQVYKYLMKHREVRTVEVADQKFETTTNAEYDWQWTVQEVDDKGQATLEVKLPALRVATAGKDYDYQYDSARANTAADDYQKKLFHFYDQLRFATFRLKLKPDGRVAEVFGFDKVQGEATGDTQVPDFHGFNLHDDSFAWFLQQPLGLLPGSAAAAWKVPVEGKLAGFGLVSGQVEFRLGDKPVMVGDRACREVRFTGEQALEVETKWLNNVLTGRLKTTKLAGAARFDARAGELRQGECQAELAGELKVGAGENAAVMKIRFRHELELEARH